MPIKARPDTGYIAERAFEARRGRPQRVGMEKRPENGSLAPGATRGQAGPGAKKAKCRRRGDAPPCPGASAPASLLMGVGKQASLQGAALGPASGAAGGGPASGAAGGEPASGAAGGEPAEPPGFAAPPRPGGARQLAYGRGQASKPSAHGPLPWPPARASGAEAPDSDDEPPPAAPGERMPTKTSIGVILCRRNAKTGHPEALLAHKRYTYAFAEFVHGRYARGRAGSNAALRCVAPLFDYMTREELFDILSLNFEQMWYRIWLTLDNRDLYNKKCAKFQSTFMRDDGGAALRRLVMLARANGVLLWEVPRGRRLNAREADILCATRELHEETGVEKSEYRFLPGIKRRVSYVSAGTRYTCAYYVALANPHLASAVSYDDPTRPTLREINLMAEVSEVRWHDIERIRLIDSADSRLESLVAPAFRLMKQYLKGRWAARRHAGVPPTTAILPSGPAAEVSMGPIASAATPRAILRGAGAPKATCNYYTEGDPRGWSQAQKGGGGRGKRRGPPSGLAPGLAPGLAADCDWRVVARGRPARPKSGS